MHTLKLTKRQAGWVEWALDPIPDYMAERRADGDPDVPANDDGIPTLKGTVLEFSELNPWVAEDLVYRLLIQAQEMGETDGEIAQRRSAWNAGEKIIELCESAGVTLSPAP